MNNIPVPKVDKVAYLPNTRRTLSIRRFRPGYLFLALALLYFSVLFFSQYWRLTQLNQTLGNLEHEITQVSEQNNEMLHEIERLHSPVYLEKLVREELGMVRPGELLFFFQDMEKLPAEQ